MKSFASYCTLVASLAGFLFGFDTVVISGANLPLQDLWKLSPTMHGTLVMSMALWGTVLGAWVGGFLSEKYGRKPILIFLGILYLVSALGSGLANHAYLFSFFRFIGGVGVGISSVTVPAYIAEMSTASNRGKWGTRYQFNIVFGIFIAFLSNYLIGESGNQESWRWMLGIEALPALAYCILVLYIPESPRWLLITKNDPKQARINLEKTVSNEEIEKQWVLINRGKNTSRSDQKINYLKLKKPLYLAFFIAFFNQWSGINFILYYAPEILEKAGLVGQESLYNSIAIGGVNLIFTLLGMMLIDKLGRKQLLKLGSIGYIISLAGTAYSFYAGLSAVVLLCFLSLFIASHAIGQGAVIWVFISEIFPTKVRALGQSFGSGVHWVMAAIITLITPIFLNSKDGIFKDQPWPIFAFFAFMMVLQLVWVIKFVPETKGISLEQLEEELS